MSTAGLKQRFMGIAPMLSYGSLLVVLAALTMAQTGMLPPSQQTTSERLSQAVTGDEVVAYLVQLRGEDVHTQPRYQSVITRMKALGNRPVTMLDWSFTEVAETASLPAEKAGS